MKKKLALSLVVALLCYCPISNVFAASSNKGTDKVVQSVMVQAGNKMVLYGAFSRYNDQLCNKIIGLNSDETINQDFKVGQGVNNIAVKAISQADDKVLIIGTFSEYNGVKVKGIARLNKDGTLDKSFNQSGKEIDGLINVVKLQPDGKIIIAGGLKSYGDIKINGIARLNSDGSLDQSFDPQIGPQFNGIRNGVIQKDVFYDAPIDDLVVQLDGKIVIVGRFTSYNKTSQGYIARLNQDGTLDQSFQSGQGASGPLERIFIQPDGRLIIVGEFVKYNNELVTALARLNQDGTLDKNFRPELNNFVKAALFYENGDIVLGGDFTIYNGKKVDRIIKINSLGVLDEKFSAANRFSGPVFTMALRSDNKIAVGGQFVKYNDQEVNNFAIISDISSITIPTITISTTTIATTTVTGPISSPICQSWGYGEWGECINGRQARRIISTYPGGCTGGSPETTRLCGISEAPANFLKSNQGKEIYFIDNNQVKHSLSEKVFNSYFSQNKPTVKVVSSDDLAKYSLGKNLFFSKNSLIKIKGFSKVYRVADDEQGHLVWIKDEVLAKKLYKDNWNKLIFEIDESIFVNYQVVNDSDADGLSDFEENDRKTDPQKADTDNDSYLDSEEIFFGYNPLL